MSSVQSEAAEERGDFDRVPDGKYQVNVEKAELTEAQTQGQPDAEVDAPHHRATSTSTA